MKDKKQGHGSHTAKPHGSGAVHEELHTRKLPPAPTAVANRFAKSRIPFGNPVSTAKNNPTFIAPPAPTTTNFNLSMATILPDEAEAAETAGTLVFHCVGDTGGVYGDDVEAALAAAMEGQINSAKSANEPVPGFYYNLGDVVYFNGISTLYGAQFYEPYQYYPAAIVAIPGNHDGDNRSQPGDPVDTEPSLYGFMKNFCDTSPENIYPYRATMTQPYCYWTLECPFVTIIGLYSNVEGSLDARGASQQQNWLTSQMQGADPNKALIVAAHHPAFSLDSVHGGYPDIGIAIDSAVKSSRRVPAAVLSGHVHNYQRFERALKGKKVPYIVAGAGGYANRASLMHHMNSGGNYTLPFQTTRQDVKLMNYNESDPGFLRVTVNSSNLKFEYFIVPFADISETSPQPQLFDSVEYKWNS